MKNWFSICVMFSIILSGCAAAPTQAPAPPPILPSPTLVEEASPTTMVLTATQETVPLQATPALATEQTATMQPSETAQPTATSGLVMQPVGGSSATLVSQPQSCQPPPQGWIQYTVRRNDTLSSLGQSTGVGWQRIQSANCLAGSTIFAGQTLWLPFVPAPPPVVTTNASGGGPTAPPPGPGNPKVSVAPRSGVAGTVFIITIEDYPPNTDITLEVTFADTGESLLIVILLADAEGNASLRYQSQTDASPGHYNVFAASHDLSITKSGEFEIVAAQ